MRVWLLLFIISIPAISALFPQGYFYTHDGAYHLIRLVNFYKELLNGQFPVRWASDLAYGFGYPVFNYSYPLLYYLGSAVHTLGFSFEDSLKIILGAATVLSVFAMFVWLRGHFRIIPSICGAIIYLYTPFRFSQLYVNGHFGAVLELLFIPAILAALDRILIRKNHKLLPLLSLLLALYFTAHNITTLIFLPFLLVYFLVLLITQKIAKKELTNLLFAVCLGVGLSSFFILPAAFEAKYTHMSLGEAADYQANWPTLSQLIYSKWGYGYSGKGILANQSFQLGIGQQMVFGIAAILLIYSLIQKRKYPPLIPFMLFWLALSVFLMLEQSQFIWQGLKIMHRIQYPWRFLIVPMVIAPFLAGWILEFGKKKWLAVLLIIVVLINNRNYLRTWENKRYTVSDYQKDWSLVNGSTDIAWESMPVWSKEIPKRDNPSKIEYSGDVKVDNLEIVNPYKKTFTIESKYSQLITLNYFYFPSWEVSVDGKEVKIWPSYPKGMIVFPINAGKHQVLLKMVGTDLQNLSNMISAASLLGILIWIFRLHPKGAIGSLQKFDKGY